MTQTTIVEKGITQIEIISGIQTEINVEWVQGLPGPKGDPGDGTSIYINADVAIGGHRIVKATTTGCDYASNDNPDDINRVLGITDAAYSQGELVKIRTSAEIIEPSWNFTIGAVYLSINGTLTQTIPTTGFVKQIGVATAPTKLVIQLQPSIKVI